MTLSRFLAGPGRLSAPFQARLVCLVFRIPEYRQFPDALALAAHAVVGEKGLQGGPESGILSTSESACKA